MRRMYRSLGAVRLTTRCMLSSRCSQASQHVIVLQWTYKYSAVLARTAACLQVLSDAVPVDPDEIEAVVGTAAGEARMRIATAGAHSGSDTEPALPVSAAVA